MNKRGQTEHFPEITNTEEAFAYLELFANLEKGITSQEKRNYRLDRMSFLLELFQNPHLALKTIHIAGTKGKGSTAVLAASVLEAAGYRTGMYSSPHVFSFLERITVALVPPPEEMLVMLVNRIRNAIQDLRRNTLPGSFAPTTFELLTLLAFLVFRECNCEYGVIETGIGGRLDATNIVSPIGSIITPLDLEHTNLLGHTLREIAYEKGGIIKQGVPVFSACQEAEVRQVFRGLCQKTRSRVLFLDEETEILDLKLTAAGTYFDLKPKNSEVLKVHLTLKGNFQAENAALAYLALSHLLPSLHRKAYILGFERASLPGRMETVSDHPPVILDGAHTPLSVRRLLDSFRVLYPNGGILIFGSLLGKNPTRMAEILTPFFKEIIISTPGTFKESNPAEVLNIFKSLMKKTILEKDPARAIELAIKKSRGSTPILVTGSFYMISEVRNQILKTRGTK